MPISHWNHPDESMGSTKSITLITLTYLNQCQEVTVAGSHTAPTYKVHGRRGAARAMGGNAHGHDYRCSIPLKLDLKEISFQSEISVHTYAHTSRTYAHTSPLPKR